MPEGNNINIGFDIPKLEAQKERVLQIFIELFGELEKYDNKALSPINISGLAELNQSVKETATQLEKLNKLISDLNSNTEKQSSTASKTAASTKAVSTETQALTVKLSDLNLKTQQQIQLDMDLLGIEEKLDEVTKSRTVVIQPQFNPQNTQIETERAAGIQTPTPNVSVIPNQTTQNTINPTQFIQERKELDEAERKEIQTLIESTKQRIAEANVMNDIQLLQMKLIELDVADAGAKAELSVAIRERTRILRESAQATNEDFMNRKLEDDMNKRLAQSEKDQATADAQYTRERVKAKRDAAIASKNEENQMRNEAKAAMDLSKTYLQLKQNVRDLENDYVRIGKSKGFKSPEANIAFANLQDANAELSGVEKKLDDAGSSGAVRLGRELTGMLSTLRQVAYILPGIGLAGIFDLAFQSIVKVVQELGFFDDKVQRLIDYQKALAEETDKANRNVREQADLFKSAGSENTDYYERMLKLQQESGVPYEKQLRQVDELNKAQKQSADNMIEDLSRLDASRATPEEIRADIIKEQFELNSQLTSVQEQRAKIIDKLLDTENKLYTKRNEPLPASAYVNQVALANAMLQKSGAVSGLEDTKSFLDNELKNLDTQISTMKGRLGDITGAIQEQTKSNTTIEEENIKRQKYFAEQARIQRLDTYKNEESDIKQQTDLIINSDKYSMQRRLDAMSKQYSEEREFILKNEKEVLINPESTDTQKVTARKDAAEALLQLERNFNHQTQELRDDFRQRDLTAEMNITKSDQEQVAKSYEEIYKDEKRTLSERLNALGTYVQARKAQIDAEITHEKDLESFHYKSPEQQKAIDVKGQEQTQVLQAETVRRVNELTSSYVQQTIKDLKEENEQTLNNTDVEEKYTLALTTLDRQFEKGKVSVDKFVEARKALEFNKTIAFDTRNVDAAMERIKNDQETIEKINEDVQKAALGYNEAERSGDFNLIQQRKVRLDQLVDGQKKANTILLEDNKSYQQAALKLEEDRIKAQMQIDQQVADNWKQIYDQIFDLAKEVVDAQFEKRIEMTERNIELTDKMYEHEIDAISRSSLAEKDKTAQSVKLKAQEALADEQAQRRIRKAKHDEAVADKAITIAKIAWDTEQAVVGALTQVKFLGLAAAPLAISLGVLGAIALARAAATPVPALAKGTEDWVGGFARVGEAGPETIKEPGKFEYHVETETIKYLPKHTKVIPQYTIPTISEKSKDESWEQTKWLASQLYKANKKSEQKIVNNIRVDLGWETYKYKILYGK